MYALSDEFIEITASCKVIVHCHAGNNLSKNIQHKTSLDVIDDVGLEVKWRVQDSMLIVMNIFLFSHNIIFYWKNNLWVRCKIETLYFDCWMTASKIMFHKNAFRVRGGLVPLNENVLETTAFYFNILWFIQQSTFIEEKCTILNGWSYFLHHKSEKNIHWNNHLALSSLLHLISF